MKKDTSWGRVAEWYNELFDDKNTYQKAVILPNLLRVMDIKKGDVVLDLACGQGFFSREFNKKGAKVIGVDISKELIDIAIKNSPKGIEYHVSSADRIEFIADQSVDKAAIILATQNIDNFKDALRECNRVLRPEGRLFIVLNHPAFRTPKESSWGWDPSANSGQGAQYRRVDRYLSELKAPIQMHPGENPKEITLSFHRPLQSYFKAFRKNNFVVAGLEEWVSNRKSEPGPRAAAENRARSEIPLFMFLELRKIKL